MTNQRGALWSRDPPSTNHSSPGDGDHVDDEDVADHGHQGDQHVADSQQDRHGARHLPAVSLFRLVILSTINNLHAMVFCHLCADLIEGLVRGAHQVELPCIVQAKLGQGGAKRGSDNIKVLCLCICGDFMFKGFKDFW